MDKYSGKKLDGRYEIHELIGVGGMAMVYRAYDTIDDRTVAIKILKEEFSKNEEFIRRFKNESKAIAVLSHANIVKVYDVSFGDMIQYIVMEYIDGITLKEYIDQMDNIDWKEAVFFTVQILKALQHAHEKGIVHRDIKPQNIMLLQDGTIKVTDFGIARFANTESRTMTDKAIGSVHYIAPEQAKGDLTDGKTDVYSVGVMLYEMLTGKLPFEADNAVSVAIMQLQSKPKPPKEINPNIPDGLEDITIKAMQKDPTMRYQSAGEMLRDIDAFRENPSIRFEYTYFSEDDSEKYETAINDVRASASPVDGEFADNYALQEAAEKRKSPATNIVVGIIIAFALVAITCVVLGLFQSCENDTLNAVDIPNFVGMNIDDIKNNENYKFTYDIINSYDDTQAMGIVLKQEPTPSSKKIREGSTISLTVNSTNTMVSVPYINGETLEAAKSKLEAKNLNAEIIYVEDVNVAVDFVSDTSPKAGSEVEVDTPIKLFVSKKADNSKKTVPSLVGLSITDAKAKLDSEGIEFDYEYNEEVDMTKDSVIGQSPMSGAVIGSDGKVKLVVAKGLLKEKTLELNVDMPSTVTDTVFVRVTINGVVSEEYSKSIVPAFNQEYKIKVKGKETCTVIVEIEGNMYRVYDINFETEKIDKTEYKYPTEEPTTAPTEAPTQAPTDWTTTPTPTYSYDAYQW